MTVLSVRVEASLADAYRNAAFWQRVALRELVIKALEDGVEKMHAGEVTLTEPATGDVMVKKEGEPYPARTRKLKVGRRLS